MTPTIIQRAKAYASARAAMYDANKLWHEAQRLNRAESTIKRLSRLAMRMRDASESAAGELADAVLRELKDRGEL